MRTFYEKYRSNIYSQNGEDGILNEVFSRLKIENGTFCEFGASDGKYCSNTRALLELGWTGKLIESEAGYSKTLIDNTIDYDIELYFGNVTPVNVNDLVPQELNLLSIDVDNDDYNIWTAYNGRPDVVVIEINSGIAPSEIEIPGKRGASYSAMVILAKAKGYFLLAHTGNCVFVRSDHRHLFPEIEGDGIDNADAYFNRSWL